MSSAPAAALSTAPLSLSQEEQNLKSLWTALSVAEKQRDRRGLEFGKACYELRASAEGVQGGTTFRPTLEKLGIPHSTAYFWIARYEESVGEREASPKVGIREAEPKPAAVAPVKTLGEMPAFGEAPEPAETAPKTYAEANDEELQALAHRLDSVLGKIEGITLDAQSLVDKPKWRGLLWRELPSFPSVVAQCDKLAKSAAQLAETASRLLTGSCVKPEVKPAKSEPSAVNSGVIYTKDFLSKEDADRLFAELKTLPWKQHETQMYGMREPAPQEYAWMGDSPQPGAWTASPHNHKAGETFEPIPWTPAALEIREKVYQKTGVLFDSLNFNHYRNGADHLPWHVDKEDEGLWEFPIASVSLGAERDFQTQHYTSKNPKKRHKRVPDGPVFTQRLAHGSLAVMPAGSQGEFQHRLKSCSKREAETTGERINLTFRMMTPSTND